MKSHALLRGNFISIDLGYRSFDLSMHETTHRAEFEGHGPTLSVSITF